MGPSGLLLLHPLSSHAIHQHHQQLRLFEGQVPPSLASIVILSFDCLVIVLIYIRGFVFLVKLRWIIPFSIKQIIIEFAILEFSCLIRIIKNYLVYFILILPSSSKSIDTNCYNSTKDAAYLLYL